MRLVTITMISMIALVGCAKKEGTVSVENYSASDGVSKILTSKVEASGACTYGGIRITNVSGSAAPNTVNVAEILQTKLVCNPSQDKSMIAKIFDEPASTSCATGGKKIVIGLDGNQDQELAIDEVTETEVWCGAVTQQAAFETSNDVAKLRQNTPEPVGTNCPFGGSKIAQGYDVNANNTLDVNEIIEVSYLCNGQNDLIRIYQESVGENCASGGKRIVTGTDLNGNSQLEDNEIKDTQYVCDGTNTVTNTVINTETNTVVEQPASLKDSTVCTGPLENWPDLLWSYKLNRFTNGDVLVNSSVMTPSTSVNNIVFYPAVDMLTKLPVSKFVFDLVGTANWGTWTIFLDESKASTFVFYKDPDVGADPRVWSMSSASCVVTTY